MEERKAPPLGCKPGWMLAWSRIGELISAIERQYEAPNGNTKLIEGWATEIQMQCEIIEATERSFKEREV